MFKTWMLLVLIVHASFANTLPNLITINKPSGISIRETVDPKSEAIGAVYDQYQYVVTDGKKSYLKVKTNNGIVGWAWVGENDLRFKYLNNKVTSIVDYNIPVVAPNKKGLIQPNETVELISTWHSRLKVKTPDNKHGWIYVGKYNEPWITFNKPSVNNHILFANFENKAIHGNGETNTAYANFSAQNNAYQFISSEQSNLTIEYDINDVNNNSVLNIHHKSAAKNTASISITINDTLFIKNFKPIDTAFKIDSFHIGHLLKEGPNTLSISLEESTTPYFIKELTISI